MTLSLATQCLLSVFICNPKCVFFLIIFFKLIFLTNFLFVSSTYSLKTPSLVSPLPSFWAAYHIMLYSCTKYLSYISPTCVFLNLSYIFILFFYLRSNYFLTPLTTAHIDPYFFAWDTGGHNLTSCLHKHAEKRIKIRERVVTGRGGGCCDGSVFKVLSFHLFFFLASLRFML